MKTHFRFTNGDGNVRPVCNVQTWSSLTQDTEEVTCRACRSTWLFRDAVGLVKPVDWPALTDRYTTAINSVAPLEDQVGGDHYKGKAIQPVEYIHENGLTFLEGCIVKRITRHRDKNGAEDIRKIMHECRLILQLEYGEKE